MECPVCKKEFVSETGRRPKKFCSDPCKVKFWNAFKRVSENNKPENMARIESERKGYPKLSDEAGQNPILAEAEDTYKQIASYEEEIKGLPDIGLGKQRKKFLQNKIYELRKQLTTLP